MLKLLSSPRDSQSQTRSTSVVATPRGGQSIHRAAPCIQGILSKRSKTLKTWSKIHCMLTINGVRARMEYTKVSSSPSKSGRAPWKGFEIEQVEQVVRPKGSTDVQFNVVLHPPTDDRTLMVRGDSKVAPGETIFFKCATPLETTSWILAIESCMNMDHVVIYMKSKIAKNHRRRMMKVFFKACKTIWLETMERRENGRRWGKAYQERRVRGAVRHCFKAWCTFIQEKTLESRDNRFVVRLMNRAMDRWKNGRTICLRHAFEKWEGLLRDGSAVIDDDARTALEIRLATMLAASVRRVKELEKAQKILTSQLIESRNVQTEAEQSAASAEAAVRKMRDPTRLKAPSGYTPPTFAHSSIDLNRIDASVAKIMTQFEEMETAAKSMNKWKEVLATGHDVLQHAMSVLSPGSDHTRGYRSNQDELSRMGVSEPIRNVNDEGTNRLQASLPVLGVPSPTKSLSPESTGAWFYIFAEHWVADGSHCLRAIKTTWLKRLPKESTALLESLRVAVLKGQTITFVGEPKSANDFVHWHVQLDFSKCNPPFL